MISQVSIQNGIYILLQHMYKTRVVFVLHTYKCVYIIMLYMYNYVHVYIVPVFVQDTRLTICARDVE